MRADWQDLANLLESVTEEQGKDLLGQLSSEDRANVLELSTPEVQARYGQPEPQEETATPTVTTFTAKVKQPSKHRFAYWLGVFTGLVLIFLCCYPLIQFVIWAGSR